jgi:hypothetical protein
MFTRFLPTTSSAVFQRGVWVAIVALFGCGAERQGAAPPAAALAQSRQAQNAFQGIERKWRAGVAERAAAEASLRAFMGQHSSDGRSQLARSYLAWLHLERGDAPAARALATEARKGPPGVARDLADIVEAGVARRMGDPRVALSLLRPLTDRVIDPQHRLLHAQELSEAAIAAERWELVPHALRGQLAAGRASGVDSEADVRLTLDSLPRPALREAFDQLRRVESPHEEEGWLFDTIWRRLASLALAERDSTLARALLADDARVGPNAFELESLRRLAARHDIAPRAIGRRVGLLLEPGERLDRARSAQVAAGAVAALGLGGGPSPDVRLVSRVREEGESTAEALQALRSEGAVLLVAGLSEQTSREAMRFAEKQGVGVLLLTRPSALPADLVFTYVLGPAGEQPDDGDAFIPTPATPSGVALYEALGHDAVALAAATLAELDAPTTAQPNLVKRFQRRAATGLRSAEAELWSTRETGFDGGRVLEREASGGGGQ